MGPPAPYLPVPCRAADGLDACPIPPKHTRPENSEHGPSTLGQSSAFPLGTDPSGGPLSVGSRPSGGKEAPRAPGPVPSPEEGAERTKHSKTRRGGSGRRGGSSRPLDGYLTRLLAPVFSPPSQEGNRKHPRSLQGSSRPSQEPSDSKVRPQPAGLGSRTARLFPGPQPLTPLVHTGLVKAEDKSRSYRAKKQDGPSPEDVRRKVPAAASTVSKEVPAPTAHLAPGGVSCVVGPRPGLDGGADPGHVDGRLSVDPGFCAWHPGCPGAPASP